MDTVDSGIVLSRKSRKIWPGHTYGQAGPTFGNRAMLCFLSIQRVSISYWTSSSSKWWNCSKWLAYYKLLRPQGIALLRLSFQVPGGFLVKMCAEFCNFFDNSRYG